VKAAKRLQLIVNASASVFNEMVCAGAALRAIRRSQLPLKRIVQGEQFGHKEIRSKIA